MNFSDSLRTIEKGQNLSIEETKELFDSIFADKLSETEIAGILVALRMKGESASEIEGAVRSMRGKMLAVSAPEGAIDIVGTGGDKQNTFNVSTAAAFVAAGAGAIVAKHGNRAATSLSGASDVLAALGVNLEAPLERAEKALQEIGVAFLFAPNHHPAMRFVAPVRKKLGVRTIFNLLGPLTNPANVKRHMIGVYDPLWTRPMIETLKSLGSERIWVAHGHSGLDEISTTGPTSVTEMKDGKLGALTLTPQDFGLETATLEAIRGGDSEANAKSLARLLDGEKGPYRDIVVMNAAAALIVAGKADAPMEAARLAAAAIDNGAAKEKLEALARITHG